VAFSQLATTVARTRAEQSNSNLQKLLSSPYGTFDSENGDSDQHSCNSFVKRLFGDVSGNSQGGPLGLTLGANQTEEATVITSTYSGQFGGASRRGQESS
jgi:hypothetical protein